MPTPQKMKGFMTTIMNKRAISIISLFATAVITILSLSSCEQEITQNNFVPLYENIVKKIAPSVNLESVKEFLFGDSRSPRIFRLSPNNLTVKDKQIFEVEKYVADFGADFDQKLSKTVSLCESIKKHKQELSKFKGLSDFMTNPRISIDFPLIKVQSDLKISALDDITSAMVAAFLYPGDVKVLVRGFADSCNDGRKNCKIDKLNSTYGNKYYYKSVIVHPFVESDKNKNWQQTSHNPEVKGWQLEKVNIETSDANGEYDNQHLPNLRANFFTQEILEGFVKSCNHKDLSREIGILQGRAEPSLDKDKRKVEVYLAIYPR